MPWGQLYASIGQVVKEQREAKQWTVGHLAGLLGVSVDELEQIERGDSDLEYWGSVLGGCAVALGVPTRTLIAERGERGKQFAHAGEVATGALVLRARSGKGLSMAELARAVDVSELELSAIEGGASALEPWSKLLLHAAELFEQRVYDLLYPGHRLERPTLAAQAARRGARVQ